MAYDNRVIARRFMDEIMSRGNYAILDELVADDMVLRDGGFPEGSGHQFLRDQLDTFRSAFPEMVFQIEDLFVAGDRVVCKWRVRGAHTGPLLGIAPTNKVVSIRGCEILKITDGKVREDDSYWDSYGIFEQIGAIPSMEDLATAKRGARAPVPPAP